MSATLTAVWSPGSQPPPPARSGVTRRPLALLALGVALVAGSPGAAGAAPAVESTCVTQPTSGPLWVEYGEGSVSADVRARFERPGVVVAASGTTLPARYRTRGAQTTYWVLKLPQLVGSPSAPLDPAGVQASADRTYELAVRSTLCERPWITLNELAGPAAPVPWTPTVRTYRANVLALMHRLAERGATPVLLVHGSPVFTGEAAPWWSEIGATGHVVYEAYYIAPKIAALGRIVGPRRIRLGMRSIVRSLATAGVPRERQGLMLGFQVAPRAGGREGLQPSAAWFRYVKWNALAARQVALEERLASVWSWGWGNLSAAAKDPDKPAAACVYLWARDAGLCDGRSAAGPGFDASLVEGAIVLPDPVFCVSSVGKLSRTVVDEHATFLRDLDAAVSATFARQVLRARVPVSRAEIDAAERAVVGRAFGGSRTAYLDALRSRRATVAIARGILEDALRRERLGALAGPSGTLTWVADRVTTVIDTATCRGDRLPGTGDFPRSDRREAAGVPLGRRLPLLLGDTTPPTAPTDVVAVASTTGGTTLDWTDGAETDLLGYHVFRLDTADERWTQLTRQPWPRSSWSDAKLVPGSVYVVRGVDAAGNVSAPSTGAAVPAVPSGTG